jgi:osmoprotectant transport system permease protein
MFADPRFADALSRLPDYLGGHMLLTVSALVLGLGLSLPLGIAATRRPVLRGILLGAAGVVQTVPGLALLTLFYPLLLGLATLTERLFDVGFSALGFLPSLLALALYSMLPVLRNTVAGFATISDGQRDAARALGLKHRQILWLIELPLAMPVIMAGIRTAAVWVTGTATLSTPIGQTSLGNYIFAGLQTQNWVFVLFGCVTAALLALTIDGLLALVQSGSEKSNRTRLALGGVGLIALAVAALTPGLSQAPSTYTIGAKTFTEQYVLTALIEQRLQSAGLTAERREGLGSTVIFNALAANEIDVYVDYSGTIWANHMQRKDIRPRADMLAEVGSWLKQQHGIAMLGSLGFENAYALAMSRQRAAALGIRNISDLVRHAPQMTIAGDYEFFARPEWKALRAAYGLNFRDQRQMQPEFMYPAAADAEVDVISAFSSEGLIAKYDLVVLDDPKQALPPYDAIVLVSPQRASDRALRDALKPLIGAIDVDTMRAANLRAASGGAESSPDDVARWLWARVAR